MEEKGTARPRLRVRSAQIRARPNRQIQARGGECDFSATSGGRTGLHPFHSNSHRHMRCVRNADLGVSWETGTLACSPVTLLRPLPPLCLGCQDPKWKAPSSTALQILAARGCVGFFSRHYSLMARVLKPTPCAAHLTGVVGRRRRRLCPSTVASGWPHFGPVC